MKSEKLELKYPKLYKFSFELVRHNNLLVNLRTNPPRSVSCAITRTSRVPKLCLDPAFLPLLASLAYCRISKLRSMKDGSKFKSPSGHHEINSLEKKPYPQNCQCFKSTAYAENKVSSRGCWTPISGGSYPRSLASNIERKSVRAPSSSYLP